MEEIAPCGGAFVAGERQRTDSGDMGACCSSPVDGAASWTAWRRRVDMPHDGKGSAGKNDILCARATGVAEKRCQHGICAWHKAAWHIGDGAIIETLAYLVWHSGMTAALASSSSKGEKKWPGAASANLQGRA